MDAQTKEFIGNLYRSITLYTTETVTTLDHDFFSFADSKIVHHRIYEVQNNRGYLTLCISKYMS
ncbi:MULTISPECIES: ISAzo13-like element transposase-related protein [unclassified Microcoleus]|uniref:ISAzo13-like element transposase-related protein n=1 Tax=unclassified Microcoleus TaxID=2642155 RepID=UPI00403F7128